MASNSAPLAAGSNARRAEEDPAQSIGQAERLLSLAGGGALVIVGLRRAPGGLLAAVLGGALVAHGLAGRAPIRRALGLGAPASSTAGASIRRSVTIDRGQEELYRFWRNQANLPLFMRHISDVTPLSADRARWAARGPGGRELTWESEITYEREPSMITWRSLPDAPVYHAGTVRFEPAPGGRGTEVQLSVMYRPPGGALGTLVAQALEEPLEVIVKGDLYRFKQLMETGEMITTDGQPSGRGRKYAVPATGRPSEPERLRERAAGASEGAAI